MRKSTWPHFADIEGIRARLFQLPGGDWFIDWGEGGKVGPISGKRNALEMLKLQGFAPHYPHQETLIETGPTQIGLFDQAE